ncbi:MAG: Mur ligase domain-containing protein [Candidatus Saccharimonadales bacterium]
MHIYFSGIGGTAIGPLAMIAKQAGYTVSGSDKQDSQYIAYLKKHGIDDIHIGQTEVAMEAVHKQNPIDWFVYSSAVIKENSRHPEISFAKDTGIKISKRDELLNKILAEKKLKMVAIAGTHGKTTTTAMVVWLFKQLDIPLSYSVGAKISFGEMGQYDPSSQYFAYEADEFDRNFLAFRPYLSLITGVTWDHHEIFPSRDDYQQAFRDFIDQSSWTLVWEEDNKYLGLATDKHLSVQNPKLLVIDTIGLKGRYNRLDAWLAIQAVHELTKTPVVTLIKHMGNFPGSQRRMEQLVPNLYSDYAHTPEKIRGGLSVALEMAQDQKVVIIYEPLTNRRQHYMLDDYKDCFKGADKVYWVPSYLAREDPAQRIITPREMIKHLDDPSIAVPMQRDDKLRQTIQRHLDAGDMVVAMVGGGGDSLDEWLRERFKA